MKKIKISENGITLVALVVTIIVLIILAGISINLVLGDDGIMTIAKKAKENTELARIEEETELNELYTQLETEGSNSENLPYDSIAKLTEFKTAIANAIEEAGGVKTEISEETSVFADNIRGILKETTKNATATPEDIAKGKTAYVNGILIEGNANSNAGVLRLVSKGNSSAVIENCEVYYGNESSQVKANNGQVIQAHTSWGGVAQVYTSLVDLTNYTHIYYSSTPTTYNNYDMNPNGTYLIDSNGNSIALNKSGYSGMIDIKKYNGEYKIRVLADCHAEQNYHCYLTLNYLYLLSIPE